MITDVKVKVNEVELDYALQSADAFTIEKADYIEDIKEDSQSRMLYAMKIRFDKLKKPLEDKVYTLQELENIVATQC